ncbi:DsbA family protein [Aliifodinibius sp. S!AR15-10]|uniref:DsbA family protein n=1 Tax=Aliifodinibius sp. S!AR15-10 TaxID=2950437 RepID=UPI002862261C|nr:thioredoxin domain-containing protein [Aliifodinibius sp. S!AR15-10]MDR8393675.1 DsbA family protein [Aliifodinibius sp. S!AR15-10]
MHTFLRVLSLSIVILSASVMGAYAQSSNSSSKADVVITEFSDYQCPACAYYHPIVEKLKQELGSKVAVEYRYFPLNSHQFAALAARAAEAARNQGKFKAMHDMLFENQDSWSSSGNPQSVFVGYAKELGLDLDQFKNDLNSGETQKTVMEQKQEGVNMGVNSTPSFFINGIQVQQLPRNYEQFKSLVESQMPEDT